ncbi:Hypothetical predicted protein, partial [Olea europaea subsp. europaea]
LVTQVGASRCLDTVQAQLTGFRFATNWSAHFKQGIGPCGSSESLSCLVPRAEETASGWLHRAAITSPSLQWKDNRPVLLDPEKSDVLVLIGLSPFSPFFSVVYQIVETHKLILF